MVTESAVPGRLSVDPGCGKRQAAYVSLDSMQILGARGELVPGVLAHAARDAGMLAGGDDDADELDALDVVTFHEGTRFAQTFAPPNVANVGDALGALLRPLPPLERLRVSLFAAAAAAADGGWHDVARLLRVIDLGISVADTSWLHGRGGALGRAEAFIAERWRSNSVAGLGTQSRAARTEMLRSLERDPLLREDPIDVRRVVVHVAFSLRFRGAEALLGAPSGTWASVRSRMIAECEDVALQSNKHARRPEHFLRAILRGWGLTEQAARNATKGL